MNPTMFEISTALIMLAVAIALFVWLRTNLAAHSLRRMTQMMSVAGLDTDLFNRKNLHTKALFKVLRRRCGNCRCEGLCERWLAGIAEGDNTFCPNAGVFRQLV